MARVSESPRVISDEIEDVRVRNAVAKECQSLVQGPGYSSGCPVFRCGSGALSTRRLGNANMSAAAVLKLRRKSVSRTV
jgi:hypothetical protein